MKEANLRCWNYYLGFPTIDETLTEIINFGYTEPTKGQNIL